MAVQPTTPPLTTDALILNYSPPPLSPDSYIPESSPLLTSSVSHISDSNPPPTSSVSHISDSDPPTMSSVPYISDSNTPVRPPVTPDPSRLPPFLLHYPQWRLLLCREHGCFLPEKAAVQHIAQFHQGLHLFLTTTVREFLQFIRQLDLIYDESQWTQLRDPIWPIPELGQPVQGYVCTVQGCTLRTKSAKNFTIHLHRQHGWDGRKNLHRPKQPRPQVIRPMQYLFSRSHPKSSGYILVHYNGPLHVHIPTRRGQLQGSLWPPCGRDSILLAQPRLPQPSTPPLQTQSTILTPSTAPSARLSPRQDPWLRRTGWDTMFPAHKRGWILQSSLSAGQTLPEHVKSTLSSGARGSSGAQGRVTVFTTSRTEKILGLVEEDVAVSLRQANDHIENTTWQARTKLTSFFQYQRTTHTFRPLATKGALQRYTRIWQRLLNYVIRISRHTEGEQYRKWGIILPQQVQQAADRVYLHGRGLRQLQIRAEQQPTRVSNPDLSIDWSYHASELSTSVNTLSMTLITPEQSFQEVKDYPLNHFASVLGLTNTGTFHTARTYTTFLAGLMWVCRAICLFNWLPPNPDSPSALFIGEQSGTDEITARTTYTPQAKAERDSYSDNEEDLEDLEEEEAEAILSAEGFLDQLKEDGDNGNQGQSDLNPSDHSDEDQDKEEQLSLPTTQMTLRMEKSSTYFHRFALFKQQQERYLVFNSAYPFSELSGLLTVGLRLGRAQAGPCKIWWSADNRTLRLSNQTQPLSMDAFRAWAQYSLEQAITALDSLMYGMPDHTKLDQPHDVMSNTEYHYSLCSGFDQDRPADIFLHHLQRGTYQDRNGPFSDENGVWQARRVMTYGQQCTIALRLTLIAIHLWGGQPSRGPELCQITIKNGRDQVRNLFWALNQIAIHQPYNKSVSINENGSGITRFAPVQLCLPLLRFLIYVRPALPVLYKAASLAFSSNNYLFRSYTPGNRGGGPLPTRTTALSLELRRSSAKFGLNLAVQTYRQAAIAIGHHYLLPQRDQENLIRAEQEKTLEQQAGHHHKVTSMNYNQDGHLLPGMQRSQLELMFTLSNDWHRWLEQPIVQVPMSSSNTAPPTQGQGSMRVKGARSGLAPPHSPNQRRSASISEASWSGLSSSTGRRTTPVLSDSEGDSSEAFEVAQRKSPSHREVQRRVGNVRASKVVNGAKRRYTEAFTSDSERSEASGGRKQRKRYQVAVAVKV